MTRPASKSYATAKRYGETGDSVDMDELNDAINKSISKGLEDVSEDLSKQLSDASAKNKKDLDKQLDEATDEMNKDLDSKLSSASAKHDKDVDDLDKKLSSASAKSKKDNKEISDKLDDVNDKLSSASKNQEDLDKKLSSLADEYDKSCKLNDEPIISEDGKTVTVSVKCGTAEKTFVANLDDENLKNVYKKHVVVRLPVQTEKTTSSEDVYEEIWKSLKGGKHTELTVVDLDEKLNATGKMFVTDLFADATKKGAFVTVEETNEKAIEYKVVRLEGDIEVTNLSTPIVQLRVKLNLENPASWASAATFTDVIYNAITDLSDESETVVIDFLTDYKAERMKYLVQKNGEKFVEASADANAQLAAALSLVKEPSELEAFEHYLPGSEGVGLNEYFNSIVWVMALIDQSRKVPNFNKIYNEYRKVFAEQGSFNKAIETTYNGIEQSLFFVDYLALLINANFYKWNCAMEDGYLKPWKLSNGECETYEYSREDEVYYKLIQDGFVSTYGLDVDKAEPYGEGYKLQKYEFEYGYFHYFVYDEAEKIWYPLEDIATIIKLEGAGDCDADKAAAHTTVHFRKDGLDNTYECKTTSGDRAEWVYDENVCNGREEGDAVIYYNNNNKLVSTTCKKQCYDSDGRPTSETTDGCQMIPADDPYYVGEQVGRAKNGKSIDEILNPAEGEGPLGKCGNAENPVGTIKSFDEMDAERSTTTGHADYMCNGKKWVKASPVDLYCVGDKVQPTGQKISDEDLAELGMQFDQKCKYEDVQYVRNTAGSAQWLDPTEYIREVYGEAGPRRINGARIVDRYVDGPVGLGEALVIAAKTITDSLYVYMNGYTDNAVYMCIEGACEKLSNDAITSTINKFRDEKGGKEYFTSTDSLSIFCNMAEYKKVKASTGYLDADIAYEVELGDDATGKTKYVAYAARDNWREFKLSDVLGVCSETVMADANANWKEFDSKKYKCDCMETAGTASTAPECEWTPGSETEVALNKPCTRNLVSGETPTLQNDAQGVPQVCSPVYDESQKLKHDWTAATPEQAFGVCDADKMAAQTKLSKLGDDAYKCDCQHGIDYETWNDVYEDCEWMAASSLEKTLNDPCTAIRAWSDAKTFSKAPNKEKYYCETTVEKTNTQNEVHDWTDMTAKAWCSNHWNFTVYGRSEHYSGYYASAICKGNPVDHHTYLRMIASGSDSRWTAEDFFKGLNGLDENFSCANNNKYISSLINTDEDPYNDFYYYEGENGQSGPAVNDFICKNGYLVEAADVQEACNAAFEKTEVCNYMKESYVFDNAAQLWKKISEYCDQQLNAIFGIESCSETNINAFCDSEENSELDICTDGAQSFWYECALPGENNAPWKCDMDWNCDDGMGCIQWHFEA